MKEKKYICERHTFLKTGNYYDTRKGMNAKVLLQLFQDDLDNEVIDAKSLNNTIKVLSPTSYEIHHKDPVFPIYDWDRKIELITE